MSRWMDEVKRAENAPLITRFAPSPTGGLHLGHIFSVRCVEDLARRVGAKVILRIEDHDRERCKPHFETQILEELRWIGFRPDEGVEAGERPSRHRQSDHLVDYESALARLKDRGLAYVCACSRKQIMERTGEAFGGDELRYDGHCRDKKLKEVLGDTGWRFVASTNQEISFDDGLLGPQMQKPSDQCGDMLLKDRRGNFTYHFCVVVDDLRDQVNLVVRGQDLLHSTGRQIELRDALVQRPRPTFYYHHPLVMEGAEKLSKRAGSTSILEWRQAGRSREELLTEIAKYQKLSAGK